MEVKTRSSTAPMRDIMGWWLQCKLANIKNITVGLRENHIVKELENVSLDDLQNLYCVDYQMNYDFDMAMNSIHFYLNEIKTYFNENLSSLEALIIERKPNSIDVQCSIEELNIDTFFSQKFQDLYGPRY